MMILCSVSFAFCIFLEHPLTISSFSQARHHQLAAMLNSIVLTNLVTFLVLTPALAINPAFVPPPQQAIQARQYPCPVPCDATWCCLLAQTCQRTSNPSAPFECADLLISTTDLAFAPKVIEGLVSSEEAGVSSLLCSLNGVPTGSSCQLTIPTLTSYTFPTGLSATPTSKPTLTPAGSGGTVPTRSSSGGGKSQDVVRRGAAIGALAVALAVL